MAVSVRRHRFTVEQYHRMGEARVLAEHDRVELIEGEIIEKPMINPSHASTVDRIHHVLTTRLAGRAIVGVQGPVVLAAEDSEPEPDVTLLRPRADFYRSAHPEPPDILLVIEVAGTWLDFDRRVKVPLYARAGLSEVWVIDIEAERIGVYRRPGTTGHAEVRLVHRGETLAPEAFPDLLLNVEELLG